MDIWQEEAVLRFGSVDKSDRLTLGAVFAFLQEAAISHAFVLGTGREALAENGQAWVLSRISVFVRKRPKYGEKVTIRSWPRGSEKLFCIRDYDIKDSTGTCVRGRSGWLIIDTGKRKPLRVETVAKILPPNDGINAMNHGPLALKTLENLVHTGSRQAAYSDIDYFDHVNNVRYVQWIQDMTAIDQLAGAEQMRLDINYISEVLPGERVELFSAPLTVDFAKANAGAEKFSPDDYPQSITSAFAYEGQRKNGQAVFRAELYLGQ